MFCYLYGSFQEKCVEINIDELRPFGDEFIQVYTTKFYVLLKSILILSDLQIQCDITISV